MMDNRPVVILAGGLGSRLGQYTEKLPKPLVPIIDGIPLIEYVMKSWSVCGFNKFIIAGGYKVEKLQEYFEGSRDIQVIDTGLHTNTGGRIKRLENHLPSRFM